MITLYITANHLPVEIENIPIMAEKPDEQITLEELFGDHVVKGDMLEKIYMNDLVGEGKVVGVYVSGHWCPPCKQFTPVLAEWYERFKEGPNGDNFEIIFVSSDKNEMDFMRYFMTMPWAALPFAERNRKSAITKAFDIGGIPALVFINGANCEVITNDGRSIVTEDVNGEDFPWMPIPVIDLLLGPLINCNDGSDASFDELAGKMIGIYFAGQWSDDCKEIPPELVSAYEALKGQGKKFEIIFASCDREPEDFEESIEQMNWYALPYDDRRRHRLARVLQVQVVPALVMVSESGRVINHLALPNVENDPDGKEFPWYCKAINELDEDAVEQINELPCIICFTDTTDASQKNAIKAMEPVSEAYHKTIDDIGVAKKEKSFILFYYGGASNEDDVGQELRNFAKLPERTPLLVILDMPNQSKYICEETKVTTKIVSDFLSGYQKGNLPKMELVI